MDVNMQYISFILKPILSKSENYHSNQKKTTLSRNVNHHARHHSHNVLKLFFPNVSC